MTPQDIKAIRLRKGWTQTELGDYCGVLGQAVCHWERGNKPPGRLARKRLEELTSQEGGIR